MSRDVFMCQNALFYIVVSSSSKLPCFIALLCLEVHNCLVLKRFCTLKFKNDLLAWGVVGPLSCRRVEAGGCQ
eukprot:2423658-Amphidinium_carterae.1